MRWKSLLAVAAVAALVGLLPTAAGAQTTYRGPLYLQGYPNLYYPANSYYYPGISNEPFATNYYYPRYYNYPVTTNYWSYGYSGSAYAPGRNAYPYTPSYYTYINPGTQALMAQGYNGYGSPAYNNYLYSGYSVPAAAGYRGAAVQGTGIYIPGYGGVSVGAGGSSIYVPTYP